MADINQRSPAHRPRRKSLQLVLQAFDRRMLLSVKAIVHASVLNVNLPDKGDKTNNTPSGSSVDVAGARYSGDLCMGVNGERKGNQYAIF
jgi:hypothetical protein